MDTRTKRLVREINAPRCGVLILALVAENIDLAAFGLSYLTHLRVFYHKTTQTVHLTTTASGPTDFAGPATAQDQALLADLRPSWEQYRARHTARDLSRMVQTIIADLGARALRPGGSVYFVPSVLRPALHQLRHLIEDVLSAAPNQENASTLVQLPMVDQPATRAQLARLAHGAFEADVVTLRRDLERFVGQAHSTTRRGKPGTIKPRSMAGRLEQYAAVRAQVAFYRDALGMRDDAILRRLAELEATALRLLATATPRAEEDVPAHTDVPAGLLPPQGRALPGGPGLRPC